MKGIRFDWGSLYGVQAHTTFPRRQSPERQTHAGMRIEDAGKCSFRVTSSRAVEESDSSVNIVAIDFNPSAPNRKGWRVPIAWVPQSRDGPPVGPGGMKTFGNNCSRQANRRRS
jgi:hypothetical protein